MLSSELDIFHYHPQPEFSTGRGYGWEVLTALSVSVSLFSFMQEQPPFCQCCDEEIYNS